MRPLLPCHPSEHSFFSRFSRSLERPDVIDHLRDGVIGEGLEIPGPDGPRPLIYADYVASGRALHQVEDAITAEVLPYYSNAHTEASHCGRVMNRMRAEARRIIAGACGADDRHAVIFTGSGATAGLTRLAPLLGVDRMVQTGQKPRVLIGPYEHHSNILPWRESGAEVVEIPEAPEGGPDRAAMARANPQVIPRNHQVETAIAAAEDGDFAPFHRLVAACTRPFDPAPDDLRRPPAAEEIVHRTFCGT